MDLNPDPGLQPFKIFKFFQQKNNFSPFFANFYSKAKLSLRNAVIRSTLTEEIVGFIVEFHIKCFSTLWCFIVILTKVFRYCELPVECRGCGLTLVSAPHLARSYHHLFPLLIFKVRDLVSLRKKIFLFFMLMILLRKLNPEMFLQIEAGAMDVVNCSNQIKTKLFISVLNAIRLNANVFIQISA